MLAIAKENYSSKILNSNIKIKSAVKFIQGDMRKLSIKETYDSILVTGRSFTYMIKNEDVLDALNSIYSKLNHGGILIFDNFLADVIFFKIIKPLFIMQNMKTGFMNERVN